MPRIERDRLQGFVTDIFVHAGSEPAEAKAIAAHLTDSNLVGHDSHGVIRVARYLGWVRDGKLRPNQHARIVRDGGAVVTVDGGGGYGQVIGREATDIGIERSGRHGIAAVAIRNTGHLGRIGAWAEQAALAGRVSVHFVNSTGFGILVAPFGDTDAFAADLVRLAAWVKDSPPAAPGGEVLLPGEVERRTRAECLAHGVPLDDATLDQLAAAAASVGVSDTLRR